MGNSSRSLVTKSTAVKGLLKTQNNAGL